MVRQATGASYPAVSDRIIHRSLIPLVPVDEQRRIAAILDKADALRAKRRGVTSSLDHLLVSLFLEQFGDPNSNSIGWPLVNVGDVASIIVPTRDKPKRFVGDVPWVTLPDLNGLWISTAANLLSHYQAARLRQPAVLWINTGCRQDHTRISGAMSSAQRADFLFQIGWIVHNWVF
jgi:hypothetical protein